MTSSAPSASLWYAVHSRTTCTAPRMANGLFPGGGSDRPFHDVITFGLNNEFDYGFITWIPGLSMDGAADPSRIYAELSLAGSAFQAITHWPALFADLAALANEARTVEAVVAIFEKNGFVDVSP